MIVKPQIRIQSLVAVVIVYFIAFVGSVVADEIELFLPENNASSKKNILEFRARPPTAKPPSAGHAFVFLGRELDNGNNIFYRASGFYPEGNTLKNLVLGPGKVKYTVPDLSADQVFRVQITEKQADLVNYILDNWDTKTYAVAWQNCISLERDVARSIGLAVPEFNPADLDAEIPTRFLGALRVANLPDAPLKFDALETRRMDAVRNKRDDELKGIENLLRGRQEESQKRMERARQSQSLGQTPGSGFPGGAGAPPSSSTSQPGPGGAGSGDNNTIILRATPTPSR